MCKKLSLVFLLVVLSPVLSFSESIYLMDETTKQEILNELQKLKLSQNNQLDSQKTSDSLIKELKNQLDQASQSLIQSSQKIIELESNLTTASKESTELRQSLTTCQENKLFEIVLWSFGTFLITFCIEHFNLVNF